MSVVRPERSINWHMGWPDNKGPFPTPMVERAELALRKALQELEPAEIRLLISQEVALEHSMPLGLAIIEASPTVAADYHAGDLLSACLKAPSTFWSDAPEMHGRLRKVLLNLRTMDEGLHEEIDAFVKIEMPPTIARKNRKERRQ